MLDPSYDGRLRARHDGMKEALFDRASRGWKGRLRNRRRGRPWIIYWGDFGGMEEGGMFSRSDVTGGATKEGTVILHM